ncbi:MAG: hypothetical protein AAF518_17700 [Spirochaetota bacterium]
MYKENIDYIKKLVQDRSPAYGVLSFTSDTFDFMKSAMSERKLTSEEREYFAEAMSEIVNNLYKIDLLLDSEN